MDDDAIIPITRPIAVPWGAWALLAAAAAAVAIGTVANGFFGQQWFFNSDNVVDALSRALPFLVAAGVIVGQDRWPSGRRWLIGGAGCSHSMGRSPMVLSSRSQWSRTTRSACWMGIRGSSFAAWPAP